MPDFSNSRFHVLFAQAAADRAGCDFLVDGEWLFEVGGKGKTFDQIKGLSKSYVACDDVEIGVGNKIPLWMFGFLY